MFAQPHSQGYLSLALRGCPFFCPLFFCCYPFFSCFKAPGCKVHNVPTTFIKQGSNKIFMFPIKPPSRNPQIQKLMGGGRKGGTNTAKPHRNTYKYFTE